MYLSVAKLCGYRLYKKVLLPILLVRMLYLFSVEFLIAKMRVCIKNGLKV
jgi:hypothetical protein